MKRTVGRMVLGKDVAAVPRFATLFGLALLVAVIGQACASVSTQTPEGFLNDLVTLDSGYAAGGAAGTGEQVDLYTGALSFDVTDVSLPGNSDLPVAVSRRYVVGDHYGGGFGDWQLQVPVITGIVAGDFTSDVRHSLTATHQSGWRHAVGTGADAFARCTNFGDLPSVVMENPQRWYYPIEYWAGFHLQIPGAGSQLLLHRDAANAHAPSAAIAGHTGFPVVTKNDWVAACLSSLEPANGQPGEGFLVVAPDGRKFWFNWLVYERAHTLVKAPGAFYVPPTSAAAAGSAQPQGSTTPHLPRLRARLYATRVEDRFGNWVTYTYGGPDNDQLTDIEAGHAGSTQVVRHLHLDWLNGNIDTVTAQPDSTTPRVWQYRYDPDSKRLTKVILPDNSTWTYTITGLTAGGFTGTPGCMYGDISNGNGSNDGGQLLEVDITTPSGLAVAYHLVGTVREHADTPETCLYPYYHQDPYYFDGQPAYAEAYFTWALDTRTESGAGIPSRSWQYDYSHDRGSWASQCTSGCPYTSVWTKLTDPEGHLTQYTYSNVFDETEGQLLAVAHYPSSSETQAVRSESRQYVDPAAATTVAWPASYGQPGAVPGTVRSNVTRATTCTPLAKRQITENGDTYTWHAETFNEYAQVTKAKRSNSIAGEPSLETTQTYRNDTAAWVLRLPEDTTDVTNSAAIGSNAYFAGTDLLQQRSTFGRVVMDYTWHPGGELASFTDAGTSGAGHTTTLTNYVHGRPQTITYADNSSKTLTIDNFGQVTGITDELGHHTSYGYDDLGRLTSITYPVGDSDADGPQAWAPVSIAYTYPDSTANNSDYGLVGSHLHVTRSQGRKVTETVYSAALGPVVTTTHDTRDTPTTSDDTGTLTWLQYDAQDRTTFTSHPLAYSASLPVNRPGVATQYDALGRVTETTADSELDAPNNKLHTFTAYQAGNNVAVTGPKSHTTTTQYRALDKPAYAKALHLTFPDGTQTSIERNVYGKPTSMTEQGIWNGNPILVTHGFQYNGYQQLCLQTSPETGQTAYGYYPNGLREWSAQGLANETGCLASPASLPAGTDVSRQYDARNRLTFINYPAGTPDTHFSYYADGKLQTATRDASGSHPASTWTLQWNARRLLTDETLAIAGNSFVLGYGYDSEGARDSIHYPSGLTLDLAPNGLGQPTKAGPYASNFTYAPNGTITGLTYGTSTAAAMARSLNTRDLIATTSYAVGTTTLANRTLGYDKNGNLLSITDSVTRAGGSVPCSSADTIFCNGFEGAQPLVGTDARAYAYDMLNRLTHMTSGFGDQDFTYDPLGNVRTKSEAAGTLAIPAGFIPYSAGLTTYHYNATTNRLHDVDDPANDTVNEYDSRGNLTDIVGVASITWNRANELSELTRPAPSLDVTNTYDARGWRVQQVVSATGYNHARYFLYDSAHRLLERRDNGTTTDYVQLGRMPIARIQDGQTTYILPNYQGTPLFELNSAGQVTRAPTFRAYGRPANDDAAPVTGAQAPNYIGATLDPATGLLYLGARFQTGSRFISPDPAPLNPLSPTGLNRYAYGNDSPARYVDPFGMCADHYKDGSCRVKVDPSLKGNDNATKTQHAVESVLNKYDKKINGLDDDKTYTVTWNHAPSNHDAQNSTLTGAQIKSIWNSQHFTVVPKSAIHNGGLGASSPDHTVLAPIVAAAYGHSASQNGNSAFSGYSTLVFHELGHVTPMGIYDNWVTGGAAWNSPQGQWRETRAQTYGNTMAGSVGAPFNCHIAALSCY